MSKKDQATLGAEEILDSSGYVGSAYKLLRSAIAAKLKEKENQLQNLEGRFVKLFKENGVLSCTIVDLRANLEGHKAALSTMHEGCCVTPADRKNLLKAEAERVTDQNILAVYTVLNFRLAQTVESAILDAQAKEHKG